MVVVVVADKTDGRSEFGLAQPHAHVSGRDGIEAVS